MIEAVLAAGVFVAVPVVGRVALGPLRSPIPLIARPSLWICAGLVIWSIPLLGSVILGVYRPEVIGALGWIAVIGAIVLASTRGKLSRPRMPRVGRWDLVVVAGVLLAAALAAAYPADPFTTGRDMGVYANHAIYMVHHGRLDVPYPQAIDSVLPPGYVFPAGLYDTQPTMTVQFGHLYPAWLAQTFAVAGYTGLVRLNVVFGILSMLAFYGLGRRLLAKPIVAIATVFLAFNPSQVWTTRNTLTEIFTQLLIWAGLLLLTTYLTHGTKRLGLWAGVLLGMAAVVRIDALLLVPLLLVGHAAWIVIRTAGNERKSPHWAPPYATAVPVFTFAVAYYATFSRPYFLDLGPQVRVIGLLGILATAALVLALLPPVSQRVRATISRREFGIAVLATLGLLTAYAYFIRPLVPPFATIASNSDARSHVEDALPNLGRYLSPPVVWAAVGGWWLAFVGVCRRRRTAVFAPLLVIALGFSAAYVWNQSIHPDHFWAVRRFVPVVIPAVVLFAGIALAFGARRLLGSIRTSVLVSVAVLLAAFTLVIGAPTFTVEERRGSYAALSEFSAALPANNVYLALSNRNEAYAWMTPLFLAFDVQVLPIDITTDRGQAEAIKQLQAATAERPVRLITTQAGLLSLIDGARTAEVTFSWERIEPATLPPPHESSVVTVTLTAFDATGLETTTGVPLGMAPTWLFPESGFHLPEDVEGRLARWTDGHARLEIPIERGPVPKRLVVTIVNAGPTGATLRLVLNGTTLFDGYVQAGPWPDVPAGPWSGEFDLPDLRAGDVAQLEIISSTFVPADAMPDSTDVRELGVMIDGITLLAE